MQYYNNIDSICFHFPRDNLSSSRRGWKRRLGQVGRWDRAAMGENEQSFQMSEEIISNGRGNDLFTFFLSSGWSQRSQLRQRLNWAQRPFGKWNQENHQAQHHGIEIVVGMVRCSSDTPRYLRWVKKTSGKQLSPCSWSTSTMAIATRYSLGDTSCKLLFCSRCSTPWKKCSWILALEGEDHYDKESNLTKPFFRWMVPALAIELALDHKPSHREMTSRLISVLYLKVITLVK